MAVQAFGPAPHSLTEGMTTMTAKHPTPEPALPPMRHTSPRALTHAGCSVLVGIAVFMLIGAAAPQLRPPREASVIERVLAMGPHDGDCERCHTAHGGDQPLVYPNILVGPDDNSLCERCHTPTWLEGSYAGLPLYMGTGHGASPTMVWPGPVPPARIELDARGKCINCHDPHGWTDGDGLVPQLGIAREEKLCIACHDGHPAAQNIQVDLQKPFRHPVLEWTGRHTGPGETQPTAFGTTPLNNRHSECEDCHNPHVSRADGIGRPSGIDASSKTLGVSRIEVLNGAAGVPPAYRFLPASDTLTTPVAEYQLCFKCHSSWTTLPSGKTDMALVLNPANPSYHPVEAQGRNPGIDGEAFTVGWKPHSLTRCGDCHGSDFGSTRGPHGSVYPAILVQNYVASSFDRDMGSDELCFKCHTYDVYANARAPEKLRAASRFNAPGVSKGHAEHVGELHVPCYACHVTHGSTTQPHLLVTGRLPGLTSYTSTPGGGTCQSSCHGPESYSVNYAR